MIIESLYDSSLTCGLFFSKRITLSKRVITYYFEHKEGEIEWLTNI